MNDWKRVVKHETFIFEHCSSSIAVSSIVESFRKRNLEGLQLEITMGKIFVGYVSDKVEYHVKATYMEHVQKGKQNEPIDN